MNSAFCVNCGCKVAEKDTIALNKKLLGDDEILCLTCMAETFDVSVEQLLDKIEFFKEEGCELFE